MSRNGCNKVWGLAISGLALAAFLSAGPSWAAERVVVSLAFDPAAATAEQVAQVAAARLRRMGLPAKIWTSPDPGQAAVETVNYGAREDLARALTKPALMGLHLAEAIEGAASCADVTLEAGRVCAASPYPAEELLAIDRASGVSGEIIEHAAAEIDPMTGQEVVMLRLAAEAAEGFCQLSEQAVGGRVAMMYDNIALSAPVVRSPICGGVLLMSGLGAAGRAQQIVSKVGQPLYPTQVTIGAEGVRYLGPAAPAPLDGGEGATGRSADDPPG